MSVLLKRELQNLNNEMAEELPRETSLQQGGSCAWPEDARNAKL